MEDLYKKYNYPSKNRFYSILKENGIKKTHKEVHEFIEKQNIHQVHKRIENKKKDYKHFTATSINEIFQIDLIDYSKYGRQNKGYKWLFVCIDVFSRKSYGFPMKDKRPASVLDAFKKINIIPVAVYHDDGGEYKGVFKKYLEENKIVDMVIESGDHRPLGIIDRFCNTLKNHISRYMTANDTTKWTSVLQTILDVYNNTPHNSLDEIKPNDVETQDNREIVSKINIDKMIENKDKKDVKLNVGDKVRIRVKKNIFSKGYEINYSKNIYTIVELGKSIAKLDDGETYNLKDLMKVDSNSTTIGGGKKEQIEHQSKIDRRLSREGLLPTK